MLTALFTAPSSTTFFSDAGSWSSALFDNLLTLAVIIVGFVVGGLILSKLIKSAIGGVKKVTGGGGRGRRGRR